MSVLTQKGFGLDLNKCTGCQACQVACAIENQLTPGTSWRWVDTFNQQHYPNLPLYHLSLACNHCFDPPCMNHCPALAYSKDASTGAVTVDPALCIGCKYCLWACPYDAPRYDSASGVVRKCTLCEHLLKERQDPACVSQCPTGALELIDVNGGGEEQRVMGFPRTDAAPAIRFVSLRGERPYPNLAPPPESLQISGMEERPASKMSLRSEWPLVVFSLLTALLVGLMAPPDASARLDPRIFLILAAAGAGFSTLHLGRKFRAYRAILNWRNSWLSREIILFSAFVGLSAVHLLLNPTGAISGWLAALAGFASLIAVDHVYEVTRTRELSIHSARALFTGGFIFGVASGSAPIYLGIGLLKLALYLYRKIQRARAGEQLRPTLSAVRAGIGLLIPGGLWFAGIAEPVWLLIGCVAAGELIDRCEFYLDLEISTPRNQVVIDLREALAGSSATGRTRR
jgi:Fe-S-cluster-containing dehydrogenase component